MVSSQPKPTHAGYVASCRVRVRDACTTLISGELRVVEVVRTIVRLTYEAELHELQLDEHHLDTLIGIDSETDTYPLGATRELWAASALEEQDRRMIPYENETKAVAIEAASAILRALESAD